jgi:hypothetical protein
MTMGQHRVKQPPPRRRGWRRAAFAAAVLVVLGAGAFWWLSEAQDAPGGKPRLVLDREVVDLGALPFEAPARVVFTLTNAGDASLRLADVPPVRVLKGC